MNNPQDEDAQAIEQIAAAGVDLTQPITIRFAIDVADQASAEAALRTLAAASFAAEVDFDEGEPDFDEAVDDPAEFGPAWTVYVTCVELLTYDYVIRIQNELNALTAPHGGICDGWEVEI